MCVLQCTGRAKPLVCRYMLPGQVSLVRVTVMVTVMAMVMAMIVVTHCSAQTRGRSRTCEPVVAVLVPPAAIACEVVPLVVLKVGLLKPLMVPS